MNAPAPDPLAALAVWLQHGLGGLQQAFDTARPLPGAAADPGAVPPPWGPGTPAAAPLQTALLQAQAAATAALLRGLQRGAQSWADYGQATAAAAAPAAAPAVPPAASSQPHADACAAHTTLSLQVDAARAHVRRLAEIAADEARLLAVQLHALDEQLRALLSEPVPPDASAAPPRRYARAKA